MLVYLTELLNKPIIDAQGETVGQISDLAITTGEIFPRVSSIAFPKDKKSFVLPWQYVKEFTPQHIKLGVGKNEFHSAYLQPNEILLSRDLLDRQIVDTQGLKVVRVNDLKLTSSENELRLLGADVGLRGILRRLSLEKSVDFLTKLFRYSLPERIIAWNYIDLLEKDLSAVKLSVTHKRLYELHPADIAEILGRLDSSQRAKVFQYLDNNRAANTISETEPDLQASLFESLGNERVSDILEIMPPDDAADIISGLPYEKAETLLGLMGVKEAADIRQLLGYRENTAGGIMTTDYTAIKEDFTVLETIEHLRRTAPDTETAFYIYVVDNEGQLRGVLSLRDLVIASPDVRVEGIMLRDVISIEVDQDQEEVATLISKYDLLAIPVVDEEKKLLGIVTVDDVLDVMEEESTEDISILTGSPPAALALTVSPAISVVKRFVWLSIWLAAGIITGSILYAYSNLLQSMIALTFFIPLIIRLSDDVSTQSLALILQALKTGEFSWQKIRKKTVTEVGAGLIIGLVSGLVVLLLASTWRLPPFLGLVVGASLATTVVLASGIGTLLPLFFNRFNIDPPVSAGPLITTCISVLGLLVYLGLAGLIK